MVDMQSMLLCAIIVVFKIYCKFSSLFGYVAAFLELIGYVLSIDDLKGHFKLRSYGSCRNTTYTCTLDEIWMIWELQSQVFDGSVSIV